jgi:hypothetical protein
MAGRTREPALALWQPRRAKIGGGNKKKTGLPYFRQPGCLPALGETRGFPSPLHSGFGLISEFVFYCIRDKFVKLFYK